MVFNLYLRIAVITFYINLQFAFPVFTVLFFEKNLNI